MRLIIGLGNYFRHDDAVGLIAAVRLRDLGLPASEHEGDLVALIDFWKDAEDLILVDAVTSGAAPGTLHRIDVSSTPLDRRLFNSTHAFGLAEAVEFSRMLATLPRRVLIFGVEVRDVSAGIGLSPEIEDALPKLVKQIEKTQRDISD